MKGLLEKFQHFVEVQPHKAAFSFVDQHNHVTHTLTYEQLDTQSDNLAKSLLSSHRRKYGDVEVDLQPGDRVLLVYPPSLDFMIAFLACLKSRLIAVPVFPPDPFHVKRDVKIFASIQQSAGAKLALTSRTYQSAVQLAGLKDSFFGSFSKNQVENSEVDDLELESEWKLWKSVAWCCTDDLFQESVDDVVLNTAEINNTSIAFLQYTSGSTSDPKGVMISHGSLGHNLQLIITALQAEDDTVVVSWLPQYHDMGLIGSYLGVLYCGGSGYYFSPVTFIKHPIVWIQAMSKYKATHVQAPNFAYSFVSKKFLANIAHKPAIANDLDLSSIRHMINAAEPIDVASMEIFYAVFEKYGLKKGVIFPTYGLAEHTVFVCSNGSKILTVDKDSLELGTVEVAVAGDSDIKSNKGDKKKKKVVQTSTLVGCGQLSQNADVDVRIVDSSTMKEVGEDIVGEIWINSPSKAQGYWKMDEKSIEEFHAKLESSRNVDGYLRTGDLGFIHEGELFICGRCKDMIIIRGKNYYPHDIEKTAENFHFSNKDLELRKGCSAAIGLTILGTEAVLFFAEVSDSTIQSKILENKKEEVELLIHQLRQEIMKMHHVSIALISLLPPRSIPKTSSGKIARQWVKRSYLQGTLNSTYVWSHLDRFHEEVQDQLSTSDALFAQAASDSQDGNAISDLGEIQKLDPTSLPLDIVVTKLRELIAAFAKVEVSSIPSELPLINLGLDSMQYMHLQAKLEDHFDTILPQELFQNPELTLLALAESLVLGGKVPPARPRLISGIDVFHAFKQRCSKEDEESFEYRLFKKFMFTVFGLFKKSSKMLQPKKDLLPDSWYKEHATLAHSKTYKFPTGIASNRMSMPWNEEFQYICISLQIFGIFIYLPAAFYILFRMTSLTITLGVLGFVLFLVYGLDHREWPPAFRTHSGVGSLMKYFSYRIIIEDHIDAYAGIPSVYAFGPHGVFGIGPTIQAMINGIVLGEDFHLLAASAVFQVPFYNAFLKMLGAKSVDRKSFTSTLQQGRSVGVIPGGIAEMFVVNPKEEVMMVQNRKGFISIALETGTQIIPCYCFGNTQTFRCYSNSWLEAFSRKFQASIILFWGRWGTPVPFRSPILTVMGRPILCPKVEKPSTELINEYHELYLRETRRIYDTYKNTYEWQNRPLIFKR